MPTRILSSLLTALSLLPNLLPAQETDIYPLKDIKRGLMGEWRTVVDGTQIQQFKLRVLGIQKNFAGPRRPVIICEALDDENKLSGPVAGMSGSPVYIDGKLVGAYAYGFMMAKEQAIIGVTPIEQMLEVINNYGTQNPAGSGKPVKSNHESSPEPLTQDILPFLQPLPTPLFVSGFSESTIRHFAPELKKDGLEIMAAPSAGHSTENSPAIDPPLLPGSPVAGIFMDGDFSMSGVGTITWRKDNKLLGFGHPFLQEGAVEIPMAGAEVLTVIRSVSRSFKLSNVGPVKGTIFQDRLTAIAGEIGKETPRTKLEIYIKPANAPSYTLTSNVFRHNRITPNLVSMAMAEAVSQSMNSEAEQTFQVRSIVEIPGHEPLIFQDSGSGQTAAIRAAFKLRAACSQILSNPFETPQIPKIRFEINIRNAEEFSILKKVSLRSTNTPKGGQKAKVGLELAHYQKPPETRTLEIPIPEGYSGQRLVLWIGDAESADEIDLPAKGDVTSLDDILARLRYNRDNTKIHVKFIKSTRGLNLHGGILKELPPSVYELYNSGTRGEIISKINTTTVWETEIPVEGYFKGSYSFPLDIR